MTQQQNYDMRSNDLPSNRIRATQNVDRLPIWVQWVRLTYTLCAALLVVCVMIQVFLAGSAIFVNPVHWGEHTTFVHYFQILPVLLLILSFLGKFPNALRWQSGGLLLCIYLMYFTANFRIISQWVAALHPVLAMGIFGLAILVMVKAWHVTFLRRLS